MSVDKIIHYTEADNLTEFGDGEPCNKCGSDTKIVGYPRKHKFLTINAAMMAPIKTGVCCKKCKTIRKI